MDKWEYATLTVARVHHEEPGGVFKSPHSSKRYVADLRYGPGKREQYIANAFIGALNWAGLKGWLATGNGESMPVSDAERQTLRSSDDLFAFSYCVLLLV